MKLGKLQEVSIFALDLAMRAGELIVRERQKNQLDHQYKNGNELVTDADVAADELINKAIRKAYPEHRILSEELSPDLAQSHSLQDPIWIIDPIDGTVNYAHGHSQVAVSIAFAVEGKIQVGIVHCPFQHETFHAIKGQGAVMNHKSITTSGLTELNRALIATGFPYQKNNLAPLIERVSKVLHHCQDIRRLGSAAIDICWVACGRLDGYYESLSPWDFAAAKLVAAEAGATTGHFNAPPEDTSDELWGEDILISTPALFAPLKKLLQD